MGTFNSNILPASTGLGLGNSNQQWIAYLSNAFTGTVQTLTSLPALSGFLRLASTDTIAWRNNANTADVTLSKTGAAVTTTPADTLVFSGSGIEGPFISNAGNPASAGQLRLNTADIIYFRNNANGGDVVGLQHNTDDTVTAGGTAGIKEPAIVSSTANPAASGLIKLGNGDLVNWRNAGNTADEGISNASTGGLLVSGANPNISLGGVTASFPMIKRNAAAVNIRLADNSADANLTAAALALSGKLTSYNGVSLVGVGQPALVALADLSAQTVAIGNTTLYSTPGSPGIGLYRLSYYLGIGAAGNAVNLAMNILWTDNTGGGQQTVTTANVACNTLGNNSSTAVGLGQFTFQAGASSLIRYATTLSGGIGAGNYNVTLRLEFLG